MTARIIPQDFYVYLHRRATDNTVFYVGKGKGSRAWVFGPTQRSSYWHRVVNKYGVVVEILQDGMQEWWAHELEIQTIAYYGRDRLINLTDGGDGTSGAKFVRSESHCKKISEAKKGKKPPSWVVEKIAATRIGKKHTPETLEKMRKAWEFRKPASAETRAKMSASGKSKKVNMEAIKKSAEKNRGKKRNSEFCLLMKQIQDHRWAKQKAKLNDYQLSLAF